MIKGVARFAMIVPDISKFPWSEGKMVTENLALEFGEYSTKAGYQGFLFLDGFCLGKPARKWFALIPLPAIVQTRDVNAKIRLHFEMLKDGGTAHSIEEHDVPRLQLKVNSLCKFREPDV